MDRVPRGLLYRTSVHAESFQQNSERVSGPNIVGGKMSLNKLTQTSMKNIAPDEKKISITNQQKRHPGKTLRKRLCTHFFKAIPRVLPQRKPSPYELQAWEGVPKHST